MEQIRITDREHELWKAVHLISMAVETQISCSTSEQRTVTFEELDLEILHDKVEKKEEKIVWYEQRKETRTSDFHL